MRAIFILLITAVLFFSGCASIEGAKEVTKATRSVEASVKKIIKSSKVKNDDNLDKDKEKQNEILEEKKEISEEKKQINELVTKQKKVAKITILKKSIVELEQLFGKPNLIRKDGKTITLRFDSNNCRLFVFMESLKNNPFAKYYELRNIKGELLDRKNDIENCFNEIKLV